jgi:hypothetical protein
MASPLRGGEYAAAGRSPARLAAGAGRGGEVGYSAATEKGALTMPARPDEKQVRSLAVMVAIVAGVFAAPIDVTLAAQAM